MRTSRKTYFRKLKITLVGLRYPGQRPQCPSLSPHVLLLLLNRIGEQDVGKILGQGYNLLPWQPENRLHV